MGDRDKIGETEDGKSIYVEDDSSTTGGSVIVGTSILTYLSFIILMMSFVLYGIQMPLYIIPGLTSLDGHLEQHSILFNIVALSIWLVPTELSLKRMFGTTATGMLLNRLE